MFLCNLSPIFTRAAINSHRKVDSNNKNPLLASTLLSLALLLLFVAYKIRVNGQSTTRLDDIIRFMLRHLI